MDIPDVEILSSEDLRNRTSRFIALGIAISTVLVGFAGYLQASAGHEAELAGVQAQRLGIEAMGSLLRAQAGVQAELHVLAVVLEEEAEVANAYQRELAKRGEASTAEVEREVWEELARATRERSTITPEEAADPRFLSDHLAASRHDSDYLLARQDGVRELSRSWSQRSAAYTATLAVLAVAVFLLGLALAVTETPLRRSFSAVAAVLVLGGSAYAVANVVPPVSPTAAAIDGAAEAFAIAHEQLLTARDPDDYGAAGRQYAVATDLRPNFARAHLEQAVATYLGSSPSLVVPGSQASGDAQDLALKSFLLAYEEGLRTPALLSSIGFLRTINALRAGDPREHERALEFLDEALRLDPSSPSIHLNRAFGLLAARGGSAAKRDYVVALDYVLYSDLGSKTSRPEADRQALVAAALSDLEQLLALRPSAVEHVHEMKELIIATMSSGGQLNSPARRVDVSHLRLDIFPGELQWHAVLAPFDPEADRVWAVWYYTADPESTAWSVIPAVSGSVSPDPDGDEYFSLLPLSELPSPPGCAPPGSYRIELFVNGHLAEPQADARPDWGDLEPVGPDWTNLEPAWPRDLGVSLCMPNDWEPMENAVPGYLRGYVSSDADRGAYFFRVHTGVSSIAAEAEEVTLTELETVIGNYAHLFPASPVFLEETPTAFFADQSFTGPIFRYYSYGGGDGTIIAGAGMTADDNSVVIALVFGPHADFDEQNQAGIAVYSSIREFK